MTMDAPNETTILPLHDMGIEKLIEESIELVEEKLSEWKLMVVRHPKLHMVAILPVIRIVKRVFNEHGHTPHISEKKEKMHILIGIAFSNNREIFSLEEEENIDYWTTHNIVVPTSVELIVQLNKLGKRYAQ